MSLLESLQKDMIAAMKAKDKVKLGTIRMLKAAVVNEQIEVGHDLSSDEEIAVLSRELKQRKDSLEEFKNAGRDEAVQNLKNEINTAMERRSMRKSGLTQPRRAVKPAPVPRPPSFVPSSHRPTRAKPQKNNVRPYSARVWAALWSATLHKRRQIFSAVSCYFVIAAK